MIHTTPHPVGSRIKSHLRLLVVSLLATSILVSPFARADTLPPSGTPATVSADPLPTVQINGIVWKQAISGNKVYAVGRFTQARPAGVAVGGVGSVTRNGILAYDITTGNLDTTFNHSITGGSADVRSVAVSPDGKRLYVGGSFTTVDGQARGNFAAFDLTTNSLLSGFTNVNGTVKAVAATNTQAFVGGTFSSAGGQARKMVAAYNSNGSINTSWKADVTGVSGSHVDALTVASNQGNLIIGGSFNAINAKTFYSIGAVKLATGAAVSPWAPSSSSFPIRMQPPAGISATNLGITSLSYDGSQVYFTAFTYISGDRPGSFEGRAAINPANGNVIWINDCVGDSYDAFPIGQVLYSVNHSHKCYPIGGFPQQNSWRALAETTYKTGTNVGTNAGNYPSFNGQPSGTLLNWFPTLNTANVSGSGQAAWSVVGNSSYVALGGEFTRANNGAQQGLVRYAVRSLAPNKIPPMNYSTGNALMAYGADSTGKSLVRIYVTGDPDNTSLTYEVYRKGSSTLLASKTVDSRYWKGTSWTFTDTGVPAGESMQYTLKVKDPFGNTTTVNNATVVNDTDARIVYSGSGWTSTQSRADLYGDFARGLHYNKTAGASYSLTFYGDSVTVFGEKYTNRSTSTVQIDGVNVGKIDQYNGTNVFQQALFSKSGLGFGRHTIKVTNDNTGKYFDVDAIRIGTASQVIDDRSSAFVYAGPAADWTHRYSVTHDDYGKTISYTRVNGQSYTATFTGTSFAIIGEKATNRGNIRVSVDGGAPVTVSAYAASTKFSQVIYSRTGLSGGAHKVTVTKVDGSYMDIDAFEVR